MSLFTKFSAILLSVSLLQIAPANAQTPTDRDIQVRAGITIPFGAQKKSIKTQPRLEFGMYNYDISSRDAFGQDWEFGALMREDRPRNMQFGMTLNKEPQFLLNGEEYLFRDPNAENLDGTEKTIIGVGIGVVVVGAVLLTAAALSFADDDNGELNF